jgi:hypothetical protein
MGEIFECTSDQKWDEFQENSVYSSVYMKSTFLNCLGVEIKKIFYSLEDTIVASAVININPEYIFPYQGLSICEFDGLSHSKITKKLKVLTDFLNLLTNKYDKIQFSLSYNFDDLRSFQWVNYNQPAKGCFQLKLNYTGIIYKSNYNSFDEYLKNIRTVRRQEWNKCVKKNFYIETSNDQDKFLEIYKSMFANQDIKLEKDYITRVKNIVNDALTKKYGILTFCFDENNEIHSTNLILYYKDNAYYQFGATCPTHRSSGATTFLLLENIKKSFELGCSTFDMVGINSPNRGDFKLSFNSKPVPYFEATGNFNSDI